MNFGKIVLAAAFAVALGFAPQAQAGPIVGSMTLSGTTASVNGASSLATVTTLNLNSFAGANTVQSGGTTGDYSVIPLATPFTTTTLNLANLAGFSFTNSTFGTFQAAASFDGLTSRVVTQNAGFLDVFLVGTFSGLPGGNPTPFTPSPTSVEFSFTQSAPGSLVSVSGSLNTPPLASAVPEPASLAMLGLGLLGLGLGGRSLGRRAAK